METVLKKLRAVPLWAWPLVLIVPGGIVYLARKISIPTPDGDTTGVVAQYGMSGARGDSLIPELASQAIATFGSDTMLGATGPDIMHALASILANEWNGSTPCLGDTTLAGGPSVGPGQVYRATAKSLGLWAAPSDGSDERAAYALRASDVPECLRWVCVVFQSKLKSAHGDIPSAIGRYNGSGPAAEAYQTRALAFIAKHWPAAPSSELSLDGIIGDAP